MKVIRSIHSIVLMKVLSTEYKNNRQEVKGCSQMSHSRMVPFISSQDKHDCTDNMEDVKLEFCP